MGREINKQNPKNWEVGDTFAIKIESEDKEYDGRYFIITKVDHEKFSKEWKYPVFRAKITKDCDIPKTKEEIESLEYIKTGFLHYIERFCWCYHGDELYEDVVERCKDNIYKPDEYGYLYMYHFTIFVKYRNYKDLIYLGNFSLKEPEDEFPVMHQYSHVRNCIYEDLIESLFKCIKKFDKKTSKIYHENYEIYLKKAQDELEYKLKYESRNSKYKLDFNKKVQKFKRDKDGDVYVGSGDIDK